MASKSSWSGAIVALIGNLTALAGCGGDACASADAHLAACVPTASATPARATPCAGVPACLAGCINGAECGSLADYYSTKPTDGSKALLDCYTKCQSP